MIRKTNFISAVLLLSGVFASAQSMEWSGNFGGDGEDVVLSIHADAAGNTYTTGYFSNTCDFDITENVANLTTGMFFDCFVQKVDPDGTLLWVKKIGGDQGDNGTKITTDNDGNVYVTGVFQETADFDPGPNQFLMTSSGNLDIFIVKLTPNGDFVWAKKLDGVEYEESNGLGTDSDGNLYVSGYFYEALDFDPGNAAFDMAPTGSGDGFVLKLNPAGEFIWAKKFGGEDFDLATGMKVMPGGDVYISGNFSATADFDPANDAAFNLTVEEDHSGIFLLHLKGNGDFISAVKLADVLGASYGMSVDIDNAGAAYVTGYFGAVATFVTEAGTVTMSPTDFYNSYVAKIDTDGTIVWAKQIPSDQLTLSYSLAVNNLNEIFVTGYFNGTLNLGAISLTENTANDSMNYVIKMDTDGNFIWAQAFGGIDFVDRSAIAVDSNGNTYIASAYEGTVDINPHPGQVSEVSIVDFRDSFLIKLNNQPLSTPDYTESPFVSVYPNPAKEIINITASESLVGKNYVIYDLTGRKILKGAMNNEQNIDVSALQTGQYNILIGSDAIRIIKE